MQSPIEVYYWPTPNGHKITIALEEMGLPYEIKPVNIGRGDQFTPQFLALSPNNRMPAIMDPDGPGGGPISIFESGAIMQYLGRKTGLFYPSDERGRVCVDEWVHWQMANLGPNAGQRNHFRNYAPTMVIDSRQTAYGANRYTNETHRLYGVLNGRLKGRDFICDEYSIADMISWPWISGSSSNALEMDEFPDLLTWKRRVGERDAVKRALAASSLVRNGAAPTAASDTRSVLFGQRARPTL